MRILIADHDPQTLESLASLLERKGHKVYRADDGQRALTAAQTIRPDAAVLEIKMPSLSGYDIARWVRTRSWARDTVLIAYSEFGRELDKDMALDAGFDRHLRKPADFGVLNLILDETAREVGPSF